MIAEFRTIPTGYFTNHLAIQRPRKNCLHTQIILKNLILDWKLLLLFTETWKNIPAENEQIHWWFNDNE